MNRIVLHRAARRASCVICAAVALGAGAPEAAAAPAAAAPDTAWGVAPGEQDTTVVGAESVSPIWPLTLPTRFLTSNFMEPRDGRFHAGLDLKTEGRAGWPVRAVEDGSVVGLRALPDGYGRAVVLLGRSGRRYLYAHLERFADRFRPLVEKAQRRAGRYRVALEFAPDDLPVRRGELIALSGQSGTVGPHLHFEVRNAAGDALNPLRQGFAPADTFPPRIVLVRAVPAGPGARVAGGVAARAVTDSAGLASELPPLAVSGPVAFAAQIIEFADIRRHRLAPDAVTVRLDGVEVFATRNDSFPLARGDERRLEWLETDGRREQWLWRRPQVRLPGRSGGAWSLAAEGLPPGRHRIELEAADAAGNRATTAWWLDVAAFRAAGDDTGRLGYGAPGVAAGWREDPIALVLPARGGERALRVTPFLELAPRPDGGWDERALPAARDAGVALDPGAPQDRSAAGRGWRRLRLAPGGGAPLLAATILYIAPDTLSAAEARLVRAEQGLVALGPAALLLAADWPASGSVSAPWPGTVPPEAEARSVAAYAAAGDGRWRFAGRLEPPGLDEPDDGWRLPLSAPGRYALLQDERPPVIGAGPTGGTVWRQAARRKYGIELPRWESVAVTLADAGSGVDAGSLAATLDGLPLVVEPDLAHGRLLAELPDSLGAGPHVLEIRVADRAGLVARRRIALDCRTVD